MATMVESTPVAPDADANDVQAIPASTPVDEDPQSKLSQTGPEDISGGAGDSCSGTARSTPDNDPTEMQKTITTLKTELEQLREKLK